MSDNQQPLHADLKAARLATRRAHRDRNRIARELNQAEANAAATRHARTVHIIATAARIYQLERRNTLMSDTAQQFAQWLAAKLDADREGNDLLQALTEPTTSTEETTE